MKILRLFLILYLMPCCLVGGKPIEKLSQAEAQKKLRELQTSFSLGSQPIPPAIIRGFQIWFSDRIMNIRSIDLNVAWDSNQFHESSTKLEDDRSQAPAFTYKYMGKLDNGLHIVSSIQHSDGTFTQRMIYAFDFHLDQAFDDKGNLYWQLIMECVFQGDCNTSEVKICHNTIMNGENKITLSYPILDTNRLPLQK